MLSPPPPITVLRGCLSPVNCIAFAAPTYILSGSLNGHLKMFDLNTRREVASVVAHTDPVLSISSLDQTQRMISAGKDGQNHLWDTTSFSSPISSYNTGAFHFCNSATDLSNQDTNHFVSAAAAESNMLFWDIRTGKAVIQLEAPSDWRLGMLTSLRYKCDMSDGGSGHIFGGFENGSVLFIDLRKPSYREAGVLNGLSDQPLFAMDLSADNKHMVTGGGGTDLTLISGKDILQHGVDIKDQCSIAKIELKAPGTSSVSVRGDSRTIVSGHWSGSVQVRERKSMKLLANLRYHRESVYCTAFINEVIAADNVSFGTGSDNRGIFASGSKDGTIAIWDLFSHKFTKREAQSADDVVPVLA